MNRNAVYEQLKIDEGVEELEDQLVAGNITQKEFILAKIEESQIRRKKLIHLYS